MLVAGAACPLDGHRESQNGVTIAASVLADQHLTIRAGPLAHARTLPVVFAAICSSRP